VGAFFRNARARNTHVEATLNLSFAAQVDAATAEIARLLDGKRRDLLGDAA
jgi:hypothetical protein